jgi:hypothetical protein
VIEYSYIDEKNCFDIIGQIISLDGTIISRKGWYYVRLIGQGTDDFPEHHIVLDKQYYRNLKINKILDE